MIIRRNGTQNFISIFNPLSGFFARIEGKDAPEPFWDQNGPELLDISITDYCDFGCSFCYKYTKNTTHLAFEKILSVLDQARDIGVFQVAYGGGNPNQHPDFMRILSETSQRGIVPNYTTNGSGLTDDVLALTAECCGAVGLSYYGNDAFYVARAKLVSFGVKVNVHIVLTSDNVNRITDLLMSLPDGLSGINALIFLKYKPVGHQAQPSLAVYPQLGSFFSAVRSASRYVKIGFDSCFVDAVCSYMDIDDTYLEPCEAARFSCYVSEHYKLFPCSFMENIFDGVCLDEMNLLDAWRNSTSFNFWRSKISTSLCTNCSKANICRGGCQLFPDSKSCAHD